MTVALPASSTKGQPLVGRTDAPSEEAPLTLLPYASIGRAADMAIRAFEDDPLFHYIDSPNLPEGKKSFSKIGELIKRAIYRFVVFRGVKTCITYQIGKAKSVCICELAPNDPKHKVDTLDAVLNKLAAWIEKKAGEIGVEERQRRFKEYIDKLEIIKKEVIEPRKEDLMYLNMIATEPNCQGRGYGSRLLEQMNGIADSRGRATWLISSKYANTQFYNSHGYHEVGRVVVGNDNPTWKEPPVVVLVMIREFPAVNDHKG